MNDNVYEIKKDTGIEITDMLNDMALVHTPRNIFIDVYLTLLNSDKTTRRSFVVRHTIPTGDLLSIDGVLKTLVNKKGSAITDIDVYEACVDMENIHQALDTMYTGLGFQVDDVIVDFEEPDEDDNNIEERDGNNENGKMVEKRSWVSNISKKFFKNALPKATLIGIPNFDGIYHSNKKPFIIALRNTISIACIIIS